MTDTNKCKVCQDVWWEDQLRKGVCINCRFIEVVTILRDFHKRAANITEEM